MNIMNRSQLQDFVIEQTHSLTNLWYECSDEVAYLPASIPVNEKLENERKLSENLDWVSKQLENSSQRGFNRQRFTKETSKRIKEVGTSIFALEETQVNCIESLGISRSAEAFYHEAKAFNPSISVEDIFQASRNVWTGNYLQVLLGLPVELTPSLFAYSMLYPVTDNYLDDPQRSLADKASFNERFGQWLKGELATPQNRT